MKIRKFQEDDYYTVRDLWVKCGFEIGKSDEFDEVTKFLRYNPTTSLIGEINGNIVASVLGGYDGRRGIVHHLCVDPTYQKLGYGKLIMDRLIEEFKILGVVKISFWVLTKNTKVISFYEKIGFELRDDIVTMSMKIKD